MPQNWNFESSQEKEDEDDAGQYFNEDSSDEEPAEAVDIDPVDVIESDLYQDEVMYSSAIEGNDLRSFIEEYLDQGNVHRRRASIMIAGVSPSTGDGDSEKIIDLLEKTVCNEELNNARASAAHIAGLNDDIEKQEITQYSKTQNFIDDLATLVNHEDFERFAPSKQQYSPREDEINAIANFLDKYGEEEQIFGISHLKYTFDGELDRGDYTPKERDSIITEKEYIEEIIDLDKNYAHGLIGKSSPDRKHDASIEITMRTSNVSHYAET